MELDARVGVAIVTCEVCGAVGVTFSREADGQPLTLCAGCDGVVETMIRDAREAVERPSWLRRFIEWVFVLPP